MILSHFVCGQQVIDVEAVLRVVDLADHRIVFTLRLQRLVPVARRVERFALAAGVVLQSVFHHFFLRLHCPAQLLLAHLIVGFLQITAELLADFGRQGRHHDQQDQHNQQGNTALLMDPAHGFTSGAGAFCGAGAFSAAGAAASGISPGVVNTQRQVSPFSMVSVSSTPSGRWAESPQLFCQPW